MLSPRIGAAALAFAAVFCLSACAEDPQPIDVKVSAGPLRVGVVRVPSVYWTRDDTDDDPTRQTILSYPHVLLREPPDRPGVLLMAMSSAGVAISDERYAVDLASGFVASPVSAAEWDAAPPAEVWQRSKNYPVQPDPPFPASGKTWSHAIPSPDGRVVMVVSATQTAEPEPGFLVLFRRGYEGTLYLEAFDPTGRRLAVAETGLHDPYLVNRAAWLRSRAFYLPLDKFASTVVLVVAPE